MRDRRVTRTHSCFVVVPLFSRNLRFPLPSPPLFSVRTGVSVSQWKCFKAKKKVFKEDAAEMEEKASSDA